LINKPLQLLLVEDNPSDVYLITELLKFSQLKFDVRRSSRLAEAIRLSNENNFDVILLDLGLPDSMGLETISRIRSFNFLTPVIVLTGLDDTEAALISVKEGAQDYLEKNNLTSEKIVRAIRYGIERKKLFIEVTGAKQALQKLNEDLDLKIRMRTRELAEINARLEIELEERKKADVQLKKYAMDLKDLNATKDKFFGIIAHDLKNPFCGLMGASELLINYASQFDKENIVNISRLLNESARQGHTLLENLLEWSRSQTGKLEFNPQKLNVKELIEEGISNVRSHAVNKNIGLQYDVPASLEVTADKEMINTILRNLLSNAVKFTGKNGKVSVFVNNTQECITFHVKDTGVGIPADCIDSLFRIDIKYTREGTEQETGTGLGLLLCKEFVEKHGGRIWVDSRAGKGSDFYFEIPLRMPESIKPEITNKHHVQ